MEVKGSKMLKGFGIVEIVFGGINFAVALIALFGALALGDAVNKVTGTSVGDAVKAILVIAAILSVVVGAVQLIAGILGVKNANDPEGAKICFGLGIALLALVVVSIVFNIKADSFSIVNIIGFVIPGFYTYSAYLVKSNASY